MRIRPLLIESVAVAVAVLLGAGLRLWNLDHEAVEHFDEGIYASVLWHDGAFRQPYPSREFYSPPLLSFCIEMASLIPGGQSYGPFLPAVVMGTLTILACWGLARAWYGKAAGIFIACVVACSDFHIIYSRMALTDVPCLLWIVGSVYFGTLAIHRRSLRLCVVSGFVCGLAWWTKYTGWLPLAILLSGVSLWWIWQGRRELSAVRATLMVATISVSAVVTFSPWWWHLQSIGGYAAVSANHAGYVSGFSGWTDRLSSQLTYQFWLDGMSGSLSLGLGMFAAGLYRWTAAGCSTWNRSGVSSERGDSAESAATAIASAGLLVRFFAAAVGLSIIAFRIWTPLMLCCIALGGFGGIFLWPVLQRVWYRAKTGDRSPTSPGSLPLTETDLQAAPVIDPTLGLCTTLTWFLGLLITTPLYQPYSRLFFPLLCSIWLAAAGGVGWWLESNVSVARRLAGRDESSSPASWGQRLVTTMLLAAVFSSFMEFDENDELGLIDSSAVLRSSVALDRTSIVRAAEILADSCVLAARGDLSPPDAASIPIGATITPETPDTSISGSEEAGRLNFAERSRERLVVYVFGEPALCYHLSAAGVSVVPVSHLNLSDPDGTEPDVPAFLIIGPNAKRTDGFWENWMHRVSSFAWLKDVSYEPSNVSLLDLFSPKWLSQHPEASRQTFELHRIR